MQNPTQTYSFTVFADYYQIYVEDGQSDNDFPGDGWNDTTRARRMLTLPGLINIATARNTTVPVTIEVTASAPVPDFDGWDHVAEASLAIPSGRVIVSSPIGTEAVRISVSPGTYGVRVYFAGLATISEDGLKGDDHYRVVIWPASNLALRVLRPWNPEPI